VIRDIETSGRLRVALIVGIQTRYPNYAKSQCRMARCHTTKKEGTRRCVRYNKYPDKFESITEPR
jgi:hypothetical protein